MEDNIQENHDKTNLVENSDSDTSDKSKNDSFKKDKDSEDTAITPNTDGRKSLNPDIKNPADEQQFEQEHESQDPS